jgi:hypothetical protein
MKPCGSEAHWATMTSSWDLTLATASSMEMVLAFSISFQRLMCDLEGSGGKRLLDCGAPSVTERFGEPARLRRPQRGRGRGARPCQARRWRPGVADAGGDHAVHGAV